MFPDANHLPASTPQRTVRFVVCGCVASEFSLPIVCTGGRRPIAARAVMPEAAVHEDDDALLAEGEVRPARKRQVTTPTLDAVLAEQSHQSPFRGFVAEFADARHIVGALLPAVPVGHAPSRLPFFPCRRAEELRSVEV